MRAMDTRQVVASSSYQDELRKIEAAKRYVVRVKTTGMDLTIPLPHRTAEHFISEQYPHSDRLELVEVAS